VNGSRDSCAVMVKAMVASYFGSFVVFDLDDFFDLTMSYRYVVVEFSEKNIEFFRKDGC
jgi:hypothetical protein